MSPRSRGAVTASALLMIPVVLAACGKAGSNNEDDLVPAELATFTIGGTLTGLAAGEAVVVRLEHDYRILVEDDAGILRPTPDSEELVLDASRNDEFYAFDARLPAGTGYRIRVAAQPDAQVCRVGQGDGELPDGGLADVDIACDDAVIGQPALNDTGVDWCADTIRRNRTGTPLEKQQGCDLAIVDYPGQDGVQGRDAIARQDAINATSVLGKAGAGEAGFDFTKISNDGNPLAPGAAIGPAPGDWGCTRDNLTGLAWEIRVDDATQLRHRDWTYTWFDPSGVDDGGDAGIESGGTCLDSARCDTAKYVADVNAAGLCGASDWRLPTREELRSIVHYGRPAPAFDPAYFPDAGTSQFWWTRSAYAGDSAVAGDAGVREGAWLLAADGKAGVGFKAAAMRVRLVREDP